MVRSLKNLRLISSIRIKILWWLIIKVPFFAWRTLYFLSIFKINNFFVKMIKKELCNFIIKIQQIILFFSTILSSVIKLRFQNFEISFCVLNIVQHSFNIWLLLVKIFTFFINFIKLKSVSIFLAFVAIKYFEEEQFQFLKIV